MRARAAKGKASLIHEKDEDTVAGSFPADEGHAATVLGMHVELLKLLSSIEGMDNILESAIRRSQGLERKNDDD